MKTGDVVSIKGLRLYMTVEWVYESTARCVWFDEQGHLQRADFHVDMLEPKIERIKDEW